MAIQIQPAQFEERAKIAALMAISSPWTDLNISSAVCEKNCHDPEFELYVAYVHGQLAGGMLIDMRGLAGSPYLKSIVVETTYRDQGVGTELILFALNLCKEKSQHFFLCVSSFNHRAKAWYKKLGFIEIGELKDYLVDGQSEFLLYKKLPHE